MSEFITNKLVSIFGCKRPEGAAELTLYLSERLRIIESMSLSLLWCIVFGPNSGGEHHFQNTGKMIWYLTPAEEAKKMKSVLEERNWNDSEFDDNRNTPEVKAMMEMMERNGWGEFDDVMLSVCLKIEHIKLD